MTPAQWRPEEARRWLDQARKDLNAARLLESPEPFRGAADLNDYTVVFRYVDAPREPDEEEAHSAFEIAVRVVDAIAERLSR